MSDLRNLSIEELQKKRTETESAISEKAFRESGVVQMIPVSSSNVESIGFNWFNNSIWVRFRNGATYDYPNKSEMLFEAFLASESKGKFVWEHLRGTGEKKV